MNPNRIESPALAPLSVPVLLPYERMKLSNGIELVYIHDANQQVFKIDVIFEGGVYYQAQPLIASTAINMLNEGTNRHSSEEIADLFDYYGAYVDFSCGLNKSELNLISLNKYGSETIGMLSEMVASSVIPEKELEIFLTNKRQEFLVEKEQTAYLARKKMMELLFGQAHPYANQVEEGDYGQIERKSVVDFYREHLNGRRCRIMMCGNVSEEILELVNRHFGQLNIPTTDHLLDVREFQPACVGRYHVSQPKAVQTAIRIGKSGVRLIDSDYAAFILLNTILGGYFGSRLMSNIREEKGYTYGINSFNVSMPQGSFWCIAAEVGQQHTEATIEETFQEIHRLQTEAISEDELALVKNFMHGDLLREIDGVFAQSDALKHKLNYELDNGIYARLIHDIRECSAEQLMDLANRYLKVEEMYIVTAGA